MNSKVYKWCAVPLCKSTSKSTPNKLFIYVPNKKHIRDEWLKLARRNVTDVVTNTSIYFCEDHFDLPNDMENYMQYHLMGSVSQIRMNPGCKPSKFECQQDVKIPTSSDQLIATKKRKKIYFEGCEKQIKKSSTSNSVHQSTESQQLKVKKKDKSVQVDTTKEFKNKSIQTNFILSLEYWSREAASDFKLLNGIPGNSKADLLRCTFCRTTNLQKIYKCVQCEDVLLCDKCERSDKHPIHCVLRIASEDLYVKVKGTFPTLHRLYNMLLTGDDDTDGGSEDDIRRSYAEETNHQYKTTDMTFKENNLICSSKDSNRDSKSKNQQCHSKAIDRNMCSETDTEPQSHIENSKKRKRKSVTRNSKKTSSQIIDRESDETTTKFIEISLPCNDPLVLVNTIKIEPVDEEITENLESMDDIEVNIKQEIKDEPYNEEVSVNTATVTTVNKGSSGPP